MALSWADFGAATDEQGLPVSNYVEKGDAYWQGREAASSHPWGYDDWAATDFKRTSYAQFPDESEARRLAEGGIDASHVNFFADWVDAVAGRFNAQQSFYSIGCGPGAEIYYARQKGIQAFGVEVSQYAVDWGELMYPGVSQWIFVQDAYSWMSAQKPNSIDVLISRNFLCCLDDTNTDDPKKWLSNFITQANRVARTQAHVILPVPAEAYISKTIEQWRDDYNWDTGVYFVDENDAWRWVRK